MDIVHTDRSRRPRSVGLAVAVTLGLGLLGAIATWGLMGPQRERVNGLRPGVVMTDDDYDYAIRAPAVDPDLERIAGGTALVAAVLAAALVVRVPDASGARVRSVLAVATALAAGVVVGGGGRIATAGVIGANIGAGLAILFGAPTVVLLVLLPLVVVVAPATPTPSADGRLVIRRPHLRRLGT